MHLRRWQWPRDRLRIVVHPRIIRSHGRGIPEKQALRVQPGESAAPALPEPRLRRSDPRPGCCARLQNSNLVLEAERDVRRRADEPTGEVESLAGRHVELRMGVRVTKERPQELVSKLEKSKAKYVFVVGFASQSLHDAVRVCACLYLGKPVCGNEVVSFPFERRDSPTFCCSDRRA